MIRMMAIIGGSFCLSLLSLLLTKGLAFVPSCNINDSNVKRHVDLSPQRKQNGRGNNNVFPAFGLPFMNHHTGIRISTAMAAALSSEAEVTEEELSIDFGLDKDEKELVKLLWKESKGDGEILEGLLMQSVSQQMKPSLVSKLQKVAQYYETNKDQDTSQDDDDDEVVALKMVAMGLKRILLDRLEQGRNVLQILLEAGEIRKLDAEIGKAYRAGQLDMAFFTVLNMNIQDASQQQETQQDQDQDSSIPNRLDILRHVYTRCQEEVEKSVPPGTALLSKLLRTQQDEIRFNQLQHYLCPQPNVITLPDGQVIETKQKERGKVLVHPSQLVEAISTAVLQIRNVQQSRGIDPEGAASMVEDLRDIAKQARLVIGNEHGPESIEVKDFEDGLQPVFRPTSPSSPYIVGGDLPTATANNDADDSETNKQ